MNQLAVNQLAFREMINSGWFILCVGLVVIFSAFLVKEMQYDGWYGKLRNKAALALMVYFIGEALARGWGVLLLYKMSTGQDLLTTFAVEERYPIAMVGAGISFFGALCCVRVFSPESWGHKAWLGVAAAAAAFMVLTWVF